MVLLMVHMVLSGRARGQPVVQAEKQQMSCLSHLSTQVPGFLTF
jgi:hypothetical protein